MEKRRSSVLAPDVQRRGSKSELVVIDQEKGTLSRELLADMLEQVGVGWYHWLALPCLLGILMAEGSELLVCTIIGAGLSETDKASLASLAFTGLAIGTWCSGFLSDVMGRYWAIKMGYVGTAIAGTVTAFATGYAQLACLRFLNGFACGVGVPAALVMVAESCPSQLRSVAFVLVGLAFVFGEVYILVFVDVFIPDLAHGNWRAVTAWAAAPSYVFLVFTLMFLKESPYWLFSNGKLAEGRVVILEMAKLNGTLDAVEVLASTVGSNLALEQKKDPKQTTPPFGALFEHIMQGLNSPMLVALFVCSYLCIVGQLLTFGMSFFWPDVLMHVAPSSADMSGAEKLMMIRSFGVLSTFAVYAVMRSSIGHRWIIGVSGILEALCLIACEMALDGTGGVAVTPFVAASGLALVFANIYYSVVLMAVTEAFPTTVRASMAAISITVGRIGAIAAPLAVDRFGFRAFLAVAAALSCISCPLVMMMKETKGTQLEDFLEEEVSEEDLWRCKRPACGDEQPLLAQMEEAANDSEESSKNR